MADRSQIAAAIKAGPGDKDIGELIDRDPSIIWRGRRRNSTKTCGYRPVRADCQAQGRRSRPQNRKIDAGPVLTPRAMADLRRSRTPRQIAGRPARILAAILAATLLASCSTDTSFEMPDYVGKPLSVVKASTEELGLKLSLMGVVNIPPGNWRVVRQTVKSGTRMEPGDSVAVNVFPPDFMPNNLQPG